MRFREVVVFPGHLYSRVQGFFVSLLCLHLYEAFLMVKMIHFRGFLLDTANAQLTLKILWGKLNILWWFSLQWLF